MNDLEHFENLQFDRSINTISKTPGSFPMHWHKYVEIIALTEDAQVKQSPILKIQNTEYQIRPGDIMFIWPGELHELSRNDERALLGLQFASTIISDLPEFAPYLSHFRNFRCVRKVEIPSLGEALMHHLQHIFFLREEPGKFRDVESLICLLEMFMDFGKYLEKNAYLKPAQISAGTYKIAEKINAVCRYISENCDRDLSLEDAAAHAGFSSCYFSRIFKQVTNYNFVEYLTLQRVKRAQALLADTNVSVTEVSYQSGFKSISTFNRVFRQYKGCSPSEYRKYYLV